MSIISALTYPSQALFLVSAFTHVKESRHKRKELRHTCIIFSVLCNRFCFWIFIFIFALVWVCVAGDNNF